MVYAIILTINIIRLIKANETLGIPLLYYEFENIFFNKKGNKFPPLKDRQYIIELKFDFKSSYSLIYNFFKKKLKVFRKYFKTLETKN